MKKVFLGGTVDGFDWRKYLINRVNELGIEGVELFNPIVSNWTEESRKIENEYKENCDICLYVITPFMNGVYSIAEVVDDSNKRPEKTVFVHIDRIKLDDGIYEFTEKMANSMKNVEEIVNRNGGKSFSMFNDLISYLQETLN